MVEVEVEAEPGAAPTMYLGMDGTGVPVRKRVGGLGSRLRGQS